MTGRPGRPPRPTVTVRPGDTFGPWTVIEAGLRLWATQKNPGGSHAARCQCTCTATKLFKVSRLPAAAGTTCRHPARPGPRRDARGRPAAPAPAPGQGFGPWTVIETGLRLWQSTRDPYGRQAARCQCTCGIKRTFRVADLPGLASPACTHRTRGRKPSGGRKPRTRTPPRRAEPPSPPPPPPAPAASGRAAAPGGSPAQARVLTWITGSRATQVTGPADVAAALGMSIRAAGQHLAGLARTGLLTRHWPGAYTLPGIAARQAAPAARIAAFLAAAGGGTTGEIRRLAAVPAAALPALLDTLTSDGAIIRLDDEHGPFWLLCGQEPGEILDFTPAG